MGKLVRCTKTQEPLTVFFVRGLRMGAKLAQVFFDQIQECVDIFAACEDRAGERSVAAALAVIDRSVFLDQPAAVRPAV